jgi:uncharacterized repeat protein (TIGR01451 family)/fimbrial isopeptide formation D2 family protein
VTLTVRRYLAAAVLAGSLAVPRAAGYAAGGSPITNAATATYEVAPGRMFTIFSNTVQTVVAAVGAISVSPKEGDADRASETYGAGLPVDRTFTITNAGNVPDAYVITSVTTGAGTVASASFDAAGGTAAPAIVGTTTSATVEPAASIGVTVRIATSGVPPGTTFAVTLTARSTASGTVNGLSSDTGRRWAIAVAPPGFTGPLGAKTAVVKTVDESAGRQAQPGTAVTYQIRFRNDGAVPATNAVVTDDIPAGIRAIAGSVQLDGAPAAATVTGRTLRVSVGTVAPATSHTLTIGAVVDDTALAGRSYVNTASIGADGIAAVTTTPAGILAGTSNVIFDALLGASHPLGSVTVSLVDPVSLKLLAVRTARSTDAGVNRTGANPFVTGPDGAYSFRIEPPAPGTTSAFSITLHAAKYVDRTIAATLVPDATGTLYTVTLTALDGQPLANAGTFTLTQGSVRLTDVFGLLGNFPMMPATTLVVAKNADRAAAEAGDRVVYTIAFTSAASTALGTTSIVDTPAGGLAYAHGTAKVDGVALEPVFAGRGLRWTLDALLPGQTHTITYASVVAPGVAEGATEANTVTVTATFANTAIVASTGSSTATIVVRAGIFSDRTVITGRVFASRGDGRYHEGDRGVPNVRIFLESGTSVVTDADGRFSFHGVRAGVHVLRVDESSLPRGVRFTADRSIDSVRSPVRLVHGIFDDGLMHDVNFAVESS